MSGRVTRTPGWMLALVALLLAGSLIAAPTAGQQDPAAVSDRSTPSNVLLVRVEENSTQVLWPYTSRRRSFEAATLPINLVVDQDAAIVRYMLSKTTDATWNVTEHPTTDGAGNDTDRNASSRIESGVVINGTGIEWARARGSTRYTYVHDRADGGGQWVDETYQLNDGAYFGTRYHVRMYAGGADENEWTAIQAHREHWDWFRLRHTVGSVDRAQDHLESEFRTAGFRLDISRKWFDNPGPIDSDGWVTSVGIGVRGLQPAVLFGFVVFSGFLSGLTVDVSAAEVRAALVGQVESRDLDPQYLLLLSSLSMIVIGVRVGAIALEQSVGWSSPKIIAAVFYPLLVFGTPACAIAFSRGLDPSRSALTAAMGFGTGIAVDYAYIDIAMLSVGVVLHRTLLVTTVAVLAAGSASDTAVRPGDGDGSRNALLSIGVLQWIVALVIPLFDLV